MRTVNEWTVVAVSTLSLTLMTCRVNAQTSAPVQARNVVLVHGAWADGSSWSEVIPRLQAAGLHVTAVQNPLTSICCRNAPRACGARRTHSARSPFVGRHRHQ
jgi:hypothetical protein